MPSRRPYRSAAQWQSLVDQQLKGSLNAREFCDAQDLSYASFIQWRSRLQQEPTTDFVDSGAAEFVELTGAAITAPSPAIAPPPVDDDSSVVIELILGADITLRISRPR